MFGFRLYNLVTGAVLTAYCDEFEHTDEFERQDFNCHGKVGGIKFETAESEPEMDHGQLAAFFGAGDYLLEELVSGIEETPTEMNAWVNVTLHDIRPYGFSFNATERFSGKDWRKWKKAIRARS